jgi:DNA-binding response OmpR family regulator
MVLELMRYGIDIHICSDGAEALLETGRVSPDAILAAADLPLVSGAQLVEVLRRRHQVPVLVGVGPLDASPAVAALAAGATACVARPYRMHEVIPLLRARFPQASIADMPTLLEAGLIKLDADSHEVRLGNTLVELPPREFELLRYLMTHADRVVTHAQIRDHVWGIGSSDGSNTLVVHIRRLRMRLGDDPQEPQILQTVRGIGYRLVAANSENRTFNAAD